VAVDVRAQTLQALRAAEQFDIPQESLVRALRATPSLLSHPEQVAELERHVEALLLDGVALPARARPSSLPVLGNIAEALVESALADYGWQPLYDDDSGYSTGHGVDLVMLEPSFTRVVVIEVKSTIQFARWPRLNPISRPQMTRDWLERSSNEGMQEWTLSPDDVYSMIVQVHLSRMKWRACAAAELDTPVPITSERQLLDFTWPLS